MAAEQPHPSALMVYDHELAVSIAGGDPQIAAELLDLLFQELPEQREALRQAFTAGELEALRKLSHKLYGSASYCGTPALKAAARNLETVLPDSEMIAGAHEQLIREIDRLLETIPAAGSQRPVHNPAHRRG